MTYRIDVVSVNKNMAEAEVEENEVSIDLLMNEVQKHPELYDMKCTDYKNLILKRSAWENIAKALESTGTVPAINVFTVQTRA